MNTLDTLSKRFSGKRVLITGATSGLGEALALEFARAGWKVAVTGRSAEKAAAAADKVQAAGGEALPIVMEVTRPEDFETALQQVDEAWGALDILINNAGIAETGLFEDLSADNWTHVLDTNLLSILHGIRVFLPLLKRDGGGHIVNIASIAGILCAPGMASYNVTKAGAIAISETLHAELSPHDIDVTVSCPGFFKSGLVDEGKHKSSGEDDVMGARAKADISASGYTSEDIARFTLRSMAKRRLYSLPMLEDRINWGMKRWLPETSRALVAWMYRKKIWKFAPVT